MYSEIGRQIERKRIDCVELRAVVPGLRKLALAVAAIVATPVAHAQDERAAAPLAETAFLVDAVLAMPAPRVVQGRAPAWWDLDARVTYVINLFERLERQEYERELERGLALRRGP